VVGGGWFWKAGRRPEGRPPRGVGERDRVGGLARSLREAGQILRGRFGDGSRTIRGRRGGGRAGGPRRPTGRGRRALRWASATGGDGGRILRGSWPEPSGTVRGRFGDGSRTIRGRFEDDSRTIRGPHGGGSAVGLLALMLHTPLDQMPFTGGTEPSLQRPPSGQDAWLRDLGSKLGALDDKRISSDKCDGCGRAAA